MKSKLIFVINMLLISFRIQTQSSLFSAVHTSFIAEKIHSTAAYFLEAIIHIL